jgi:serine phosphatase RsbU (regulator of sigma subunit)
MDPADNEYGQKRFFDLIADSRNLKPSEIIKKTLEDVKTFTKGHPQHDDITLVAIRVGLEELHENSRTQTMASIEV